MTSLDQMLSAYGELAVKVGVNLQPGQRLFILGPLGNGGVSLDAAPLVRAVAERAYRAGASYVEAIWGDEALQLIRFRHAPRESFDRFSQWLPDALVRHAEEGHACLSIYANDPDLLKSEPPEVVGAVQQAVSRQVRPFRELLSRNQTNWSVIAAPSQAWGDVVFADRPATDRIPLLWDAIVRMCRLDRPDPVAAWEAHLGALAARRDFLNQRRYSALTYRGPGTDLTLGLPMGHLWMAGRAMSVAGHPFAPNLPTEEVFTMPHKDRVDGLVTATKPLSYGGTLIDGFSLRFERGRVVQVHAAKGQSMLQQLVDTDEGAARLGEVALVPHSSPISQSGVLFYNTLFDENAASHVALGSAYRFTMEDGEAMDADAFERAGGNRSATHVDFMIGSGALDIDGVREDGTPEPLMRQGEWASPAS
ncbi:MAG: aminopeptidase [Acidobacteriaceae bacterium]|jgi:aminopeptidase|nr:aminopeptidase [Acidobacteriaceae bacterium]